MKIVKLTMATMGCILGAAIPGSASDSPPPLTCVDGSGAAVPIHGLSDEGVLAPKALSRKEPEAAGKVVVPSRLLLFETIVDAEGRVCAIQLINGPETIDSQAWLAAIRRWTYTSGTINGRPAAIKIAIIIRPQRDPSPPVPTPDPLLRSTVKTSIESGELRIGVHTFRLPLSGGELTNALGPPSRTFDGSPYTNRLLIWDSLGLVAYLDNSSNAVKSLSFYLQFLGDRPFCPRALAGPITLAGIDVTTTTTLDAFGHALIERGALHVRRLAFGVWILSYGGFHIGLEQIDSSSLQTISIDPAKH